MTLLRVKKTLHPIIVHRRRTTIQIIEKSCPIPQNFGLAPPNISFESVLFYSPCGESRAQQKRYRDHRNSYKICALSNSVRIRRNCNTMPPQQTLICAAAVPWATTIVQQSLLGGAIHARQNPYPLPAHQKCSTTTRGTTHRRKSLHSFGTLTVTISCLLGIIMQLKQHVFEKNPKKKSNLRKAPIQSTHPW